MLIIPNCRKSIFTHNLVSTVGQSWTQKSVCKLWCMFTTDSLGLHVAVCLRFLFQIRLTNRGVCIVWPAGLAIFPHLSQGWITCREHQASAPELYRVTGSSSTVQLIWANFNERVYKNALSKHNKWHDKGFKVGRASLPDLERSSLCVNQVLRPSFKGMSSACWSPS